MEQTPEDGARMAPVQPTIAPGNHRPLALLTKLEGWLRLGTVLRPGCLCFRSGVVSGRHLRNCYAGDSFLVRLQGRLAHNAVSWVPGASEIALGQEAQARLGHWGPVGCVARILLETLRLFSKSRNQCQRSLRLLA